MAVYVDDMQAPYGRMKMCHNGRDPSHAEMRERVFNAVWQVMPSWAFDEGGEWSEDDMQRFATEVTDAVLAATPAAPRSPTGENDEHVSD